jgi:hypothetical protein
MKDLYEEVEALFESGKEENFEDGMESDFSKNLISVVKKYGNYALEIIGCLIVYEKVNAEVAGEALRWLGQLDHPETHRFRLWLLERSLSLSKAQIRDGASLGLSFLDDPHAITYLKSAIQKEEFKELRNDMKQVLDQLEKTK